MVEIEIEFIAPTAEEELPPLEVRKLPLSVRDQRDIEKRIERKKRSARYRAEHLRYEYWTPERRAEASAKWTPKMRAALGEAMRACHARRRAEREARAQALEA